MTRVQFSISVFEKFWKSIPKKSTCILILNKIDLFKEKYRKSPNTFKKYFPDYKGNSEENAFDYLKQTIQEKLPKSVSMHCLLTCSLEKDLTMDIFKSLQVLIIKEALQSAHLPV